jgi:hypothetical protein
MSLSWMFIPRQGISLLCETTSTKNYKILSIVSLNAIWIFLGDFNTVLGKEDILKPTIATIGNSILREIINDKTRSSELCLIQKSDRQNKMFPHRNILKFTWTTPDGKIRNQICHTSIDRR